MLQQRQRVSEESHTQEERRSQGIGPVSPTGAATPTRESNEQEFLRWVTGLEEKSSAQDLLGVYTQDQIAELTLQAWPTTKVQSNLTKTQQGIFGALLAVMMVLFLTMAVLYFLRVKSGGSASSHFPPFATFFGMFPAFTAIFAAQYAQRMKTVNGFIHLLSECPDVRLTGPLLDLLEEQERLRKASNGKEAEARYWRLADALTQVLPVIHRADVPLLDDKQRKILREALQEAGLKKLQSEAPLAEREADFLAAIIKALEMEILRNRALIDDEALIEVISKIHTLCAIKRLGDGLARNRVSQAADDFLTRATQIKAMERDPLPGPARPLE